jgi:hypothetical protein
VGVEGGSGANIDTHLAKAKLREQPASRGPTRRGAAQYEVSVAIEGAATSLATRIQYV